MRKPTICMGENKDADQLCGNREADQRLCFRYTDSTFPPLLIPKFSRFWVSSVTVQAGLCWTWSETQIVGFLMHRLNSNSSILCIIPQSVSIPLGALSVDSTVLQCVTPRGQLDDVISSWGYLVTAMLVTKATIVRVSTVKLLKFYTAKI